MNTQCITYVTDENYFFPTAVSALQARKAASPSTDVVIVFTERFRHHYEALDFCNSAGLKPVDGSQLLAERFAKVDRTDFKARITIAAMGRLLLSDLLPQHYRQVIYIDGDTQIVGDLGPLEDLIVPPGKVVAAMDYTSIVETALTRKKPTYFNSGVLKFDPADWIGAAAFEHFIRNGGHLHDQGALNSVAGDALIFISNRWNFPRQFLHLLDKRPTIIHFASHPKPWDGVYFPCSRSHSAVYREALKSYPCLSPFVRKISPLRRMAYRLRSFRNRMANTMPFLSRDKDEEAIRRVVCDWELDDHQLTRSTRASVSA
ncbi:glycosyltransferase [Agrobacterium albertimagni AOL15]|uniref:Glycosyltransferase n=1 Tax=Agrobacterium albertimagni AOL15 TaxID=1156935 RepID=K2Q0L9_9HYPH|nr:glycosyltransferase [Agrobacterium albertimagni]EKF58640.1 glycosyltransferase [Agrobacterium albertimagni AOL15]